MSEPPPQTVPDPLTPLRGPPVTRRPGTPTHSTSPPQTGFRRTSWDDGGGCPPPSVLPPHRPRTSRYPLVRRPPSGVVPSLPCRSGRIGRGARRVSVTGRGLPSRVVGFREPVRQGHDRDDTHGSSRRSSRLSLDLRRKGEEDTRVEFTYPGSRRSVD